MLCPPISAPWVAMTSRLLQCVRADLPHERPRSLRQTTPSLSQLSIEILTPRPFDRKQAVVQTVPESEPTYTNPVFERSFPDPFVLKHKGEYFAYSTGRGPDGRVFGVMRSSDLVRWEELRGAMRPLPGDHPHYWAPEVTYHEGRFYLYYSVGNEATMEIRVATCDRPDGNFVDSGRRPRNHWVSV